MKTISNAISTLSKIGKFLIKEVYYISLATLVCSIAFSFYALLAYYLINL
jgi:hypothetical protein